MPKDITNIIEKNIELFGNKPKVEKINIGFTNTIYNVNDTFIIKICTNYDNEENFMKEIKFYEANKDNKLIPKLFIANTDKKDIPYMYEIIEKINGVSLYNVWHTFSEEQKEKIIKKLCLALKQIHSSKGINCDWSNHFKTQFISSYDTAKNLNIFNEEERKLLDLAYSKFDKYLPSKEFVLIHNDLHFDNIFYQNGEIKLIDFERSMYAPRDFELDILYRMIRMPLKYASEETEEYTNINDYVNIMTYVKKYYPELINIPNLYQRLAIYDMVYFLRHLVKHPEIQELKDSVIMATKNID